MIYVFTHCVSIALWPLLVTRLYSPLEEEGRSTPTDSDQATRRSMQEVDRGGVVCISLVGCIIFLEQ